MENHGLGPKDASNIFPSLTSSWDWSNVSGLGGIYQLDCGAAVGVYFDGRSLVQSMGRLTFPKATANSMAESVTQLVITQSSASRGFVLVGEGSLKSAPVVR